MFREDVADEPVRIFLRERQLIAVAHGDGRDGDVLLAGARLDTHA